MIEGYSDVVAEYVDVLKRLQLAEAENARLRAHKRTALRRARNARDDAAFLHGILILHKIEIPERLTKRAPGQRAAWGNGRSAA